MTSTTVSNRRSPTGGPRFPSAASDRRGSAFRWPVSGLAFGGDYSPEQWPDSVRREDLALMRDADVTMVSLGVFSWGLLEVADGEFDFAWLDHSMDALGETGISVNLATPTAAPPMWLLRAHPEITTVDAMGVRTSAGGRLAWSPSSAVFRPYALRMVRAIAKRYALHPALRMWHLSNEVGNENAYCFSDETQVAFQLWLRVRFGDIERLNDAWGTAFWGQHYSDFSEIPVPRFARTDHNPGLQLDFKRFTSDALLGHVIAERDVIRSITPLIPISTNFMIHSGGGAADYALWADEVDLVTNDHYTIADDPRRREELAFSADRTRGVARGKPWLLLEHAAGSVSWQRRNRAKLPRELARDSLSHIAAGSDGAMFFQWRQSLAGSEQFHSAMVPHAGPDTRIHREIVALGAALKRIAEVRGSIVTDSPIAMLWDQNAAWAWESGRKPSEAIAFDDMPVAIHAELTSLGVGVDIVRPGDSLSDYRMVMVPNQYLLTPEAVAVLEAYASSGGHVFVTYLSGIVDSTNRVIAGGYPGALRSLLGIRVTEFLPLLDGELQTLASGANVTDWSEEVHLAGAKSLDRYASGPLAGSPAITLNRFGNGTAIYLSAHVDRASLARLMEQCVLRAMPEISLRVPNGVEVRRRTNGAASWLFAFNHSGQDAPLDAIGFDLLAGRAFAGTIPGGGVCVIRETPRAPGTAE
jgi:beta-galactosidase